MNCLGEVSPELERSLRLGVRLAVGQQILMAGAVKLRCHCGREAAVVCAECPLAVCETHSKHKGHKYGVYVGPSSEGFLYSLEKGQIVYSAQFERLRLCELRSILQDQCAQNAGTPSKKLEMVPIPPEKLERPTLHAQSGLRGFHSMGATCYMAVILQTLIHTPQIRSYFLGAQHNSMKCKQKHCIVCCLDRLFHEIYGSSQITGVEIAELLQASAICKPTMTGSTEQDAHEFLHFILEQIHLAYVEDPDANRFKIPEQNGSRPCECVVHRTFSGLIRSTLNCSCGDVRTTIDPLMDISLEIKGRSVEDCLAEFTKKECIANYKCLSCGQQGTVQKHLMVDRLPQVLLIQLKRFESNHQGSQKADLPVSFELELDVKPIVTDPGKRPLLYQLYGVICHVGSLDTGHYTCIMRNPSGCWFHFDDSVVTPIEPARVKQGSAYLLLYCAKYAI